MQEKYLHNEDLSAYDESFQLFCSECGEYQIIFYQNIIKNEEHVWFSDPLLAKIESSIRPVKNTINVSQYFILSVFKEEIEEYQLSQTYGMHLCQWFFDEIFIDNTPNLLFADKNS